jgi:putative drug exporter of the RND superfamily
MDRFTRTVVRHRRWVYAFWILLFVVGIAAAGKVSDRLSYDFSLPGQQGYETSKKLAAAYGVDSDGPSVPVLTVPEGSTVKDEKAAVQAVFDDLRKLTGVRVVDYPSTGDERFITDSGRSTFGFVYWPTGLTEAPDVTVEDVLAESAPAHGLTSSLTGYNELWTPPEGSDDEGPSVLTETLTGAAGALLVLLFVFASFLALVPLIIAAVAILSTFVIVLLLTTFADVSFVVQFLIALVGLGVAIDYSLLVVTRWREERAKGADNDEAVTTAVRTAGHAVLASGVTVAISLLALVVIPVPMLQSMGYGGMLIPLVSVAVVLTLLPALLSGIGRRVDWPRIRHEQTASRAWTAWARGVLKTRWLAAGLALGALALLIAPLTGVQIGSISSDAIAASGPASDTLKALEADGVGTGVLSPAIIMVDGDEQQAQAIADAASSVPGIRQATVTRAAENGAIAVDVVPVDETVDSRSVGVIDDVQAAVQDLPGYSGITGAGPEIVDFRHAVYDNFPYVIAILALVTFVLLMRTFRSVLLPLKAVVLNLLSMAAVFGLVTWFWQEGNGSEALFDVPATGALSFWIPPLVFAFLFGLSMDYEVFILARMREEYDATGSTSTAVVNGLGRTGRLVTSAALILFFAFAALASIPDTEMKIFSTALGVGILLDATLVRALLVPALVSLFGTWNWWLPAWLAKPLRVEPSPRRAPVALPEPREEGSTEPELEPVG